jgi:hypothetical protein
MLMASTSETDCNWPPPFLSGKKHMMALQESVRENIDQMKEHPAAQVSV